jgi:hypothetical protein
LLGLLVCLPCAFSFGAAEKIPVPVLGDWKSESKCTIPDSPCRDEHVVYQITAGKQPAGDLALAAYKIVNGQREFMGTLRCRYNAREAALFCTGNTAKQDEWNFQIAGNRMTGTLTIGKEKLLYRRINLTRKVPH